MEKTDISAIAASAAEVCEEVLLAIALTTNAQVPPPEAKALICLAKENGYDIEIENAKVYLRNKKNGRRIAVKFVKVSENARKWMYGLFVTQSSIKTPVFQPTGSFQKEIEAEKRKIKGVEHERKSFNNTKISILEL